MRKILLILISSVLLSGCNRLDIHQPLTSTIEGISQGDSISQEFLSKRNNLNIVSICIRNLDHVSIPLRFTISTNNQEIRSLDFSSENIDNEDCTRFQFPPITDSKNTRYIAIISSYPLTGGVPTENVLTIEGDGGVLHYKTYFYQPLKEVIFESLSQLPSRFVDDWAFSIVYFSVLIYLFYLIYKRKEK